MTKEQLESPSIERGALLQTPEGRFVLYLSYVDPVDSRWRIDRLEADDPAHFDVATRQEVVTATSLGVEGVKDPVIFAVGTGYYMYVSYAPKATGEISQSDMHGTDDVFNTGLLKSHTGLLTSVDGRVFQWARDVMTPSESGWDSYATRIVGLLPYQGATVVFYDGSSSVAQNYEERTGVAVTFDYEEMRKLSHAGPVLASPYATGTLRYIAPVVHDQEIWYYYEMARPDGAHNLYVNRVMQK